LEKKKEPILEWKKTNQKLRIERKKKKENDEWIKNEGGNDIFK